MNQNDQEDISLLYIQNYVLASHFSRFDAVGGGVAIFIRKDLSFTDVSISLNCVEKKFEYTLTELKVNNSKYLIGCVYRSPSQDFLFFDSMLDELLRKVMKPSTSAFICGDFNVHFDDLQSPNALKLVNTFLSFGLNKTINEFTRIEKNKKSTLDNIFTTFNLEKLHSRIVSCDISDHFMQVVSLPAVTCDKDIFLMKRFFFREHNIDNFVLSISSIDWNSLFLKECSLDDQFNKFYSVIQKSVEESFPLERYRKKSISHKPWLCQELIEEGQNLRDMYKCFKYQNDLNILTRYKIIKKHHEHKIKLAKHKYYNELFSKSNNVSRTAWHIIKENTNTLRCHSLPEHFVDDNGNQLYDLQDAAEHFNSYFLDSVDQIINKNGTSPKPPLKFCKKFISKSLFLNPYNENEMHEIILSVTKKNSAGDDGIPCSLMKHVSQFLVAPLTYLVNLSFQEGSFPKALKNL